MMERSQERLENRRIVDNAKKETIPERGQTERLVEKSLSCCRQNRKMLLFQQASSLPPFWNDLLKRL